jgi:hypothetical protein
MKQAEEKMCDNKKETSNNGTNAGNIVRKESKGMEIKMLQNVGK